MFFGVICVQIPISLSWGNYKYYPEYKTQRMNKSWRNKDGQWILHRIEIAQLMA